MNIENCKMCNEPNLERYWMQKGDQWVCAYCYNGTITQRVKNNLRGIKKCQKLNQPQEVVKEKVQEDPLKS